MNDSERVCKIIQEIRRIRDKIQKNELFSAGYDLHFLETCLLGFFRELEEKEGKKDAFDVFSDK